MTTNLKKKLIRENPVIERLQNPEYLRINFLRSVNHYASWRYPSERQLEVATRIMDDYDANRSVQPLADLSRNTFTGQVVTLRRVPRNKAFYNLLTIKSPNDRNTYLIRETKALAGVKVGDKITATASLQPASMPSHYYLRKPTKTSILP